MVARRKISSIPQKRLKSLKPAKLEPGDTIALIAPASPPLQLDVIDKAKAAFEARGFKVSVSESARNRLGFIAGTDAQRAKDFNRAISSPRIKAVVCIRGGYGTLRIVDKIDLIKFKKSPKILVGCSDITTFQAVAAKKLNATTFHGPVAQGLVENSCPSFTWDSLIHNITGAAASLGSICHGYDEKESTVYSLKRGRVTAPIIGGNLAVLSSLLGTEFFPELKGKILFFEEIGEMPFRIDRALTRLIMTGALNNVAGFALGLFKDCEYRTPKEGDLVEYKQKLRDVFAEKLLPLGKPIVVGLPFGHLPYNATLPQLCMATLDGSKGDLLIEELGVI